MANASGVQDVAKKKGANGPKGPEPTGREGWAKKPLIVNLRGSREFQAWLQELAKADRETVAGVIERALVYYAKTIGFSKQAPER